jgi:type IV secretory pathway VirJ component
MSLHIAKLFMRPLALASAALVVHIGAASAADATGDIQQQLREMLAGIPTAHSTPQSAPRDSRATSPIADAQDLAQQLQSLLGAAIKHPEVTGPSRKATPQERRVAYSNAQEAARQVVLGTPHASDAS